VPALELDDPDEDEPDDDEPPVRLTGSQPASAAAKNNIINRREIIRAPERFLNNPEFGFTSTRSFRADAVNSSQVLFNGEESAPQMSRKADAN
jgi:hypothetical protein